MIKLTIDKLDLTEEQKEVLEKLVDNEANKYVSRSTLGKAYDIVKDLYDSAVFPAAVAALLGHAIGGMEYGAKAMVDYTFGVSLPIFVFNKTWEVLSEASDAAKHYLNKVEEDFVDAIRMYQDPSFGRIGFRVGIGAFGAWLLSSYHGWIGEEVIDYGLMTATGAVAGFALSANELKEGKRLMKLTQQSQT